MFSNFLGQIPLLFEYAGAEELLPIFQAHLVNVLAGRTWASYHDYFSIEHEKDFVADEKIYLSEEPIAPKPIYELVEYFALPHSVQSKLEILDHDTNRLFPNAFQRGYFLWPLTPTRLHVIEGIIQNN